MTNDRPGSDHMIRGPMRGLEKNYLKLKMCPMTDVNMDITTYRLTRPRGVELVKIIVFQEKSLDLVFSSIEIQPQFFVG